MKGISGISKAPPPYYLPALLAAYAALLCLRMPEIIIKGRFWAEEGTVFFENAWKLPAMQALLTSYGGYLNLPANGAALAARWLMPLEWAPYLTISVALLIHLLAALILLTATDAWLRPRVTQIAGLFILLLAPQIDEGLLQTLHCQFQLTLCCGLILALDVASGWRQYFRLSLLYLAPLCGAVPIVLIPLFVMRALIDRSKPRLFQAAALGGGAAIQLAFFFHSVPGRGYALHPFMALCVITLRYLEAPFLGVNVAEVTAKIIRNELSQGRPPLLAALPAALVIIPLTILTLANRRARPAFWLFASGATIAAGTYIGAIGGAWAMLDAQGGERYVFVPQTLFGLTVLALAMTYSNWVSRAAIVTLVWLLVVGAYCYTHPWKVIANGPRWRHEIAAWRHDPTHVIQLWPAGWHMTLTPKD